MAIRGFFGNAPSGVYRGQDLAGAGFPGYDAPAVDFTDSYLRSAKFVTWDSDHARPIDVQALPGGR